MQGMTQAEMVHSFMRSSGLLRQPVENGWLHSNGLSPVYHLGTYDKMYQHLLQLRCATCHAMIAACMHPQGPELAHCSPFCICT